ncbi:MAG: TonB-dependent receptor [Leptospiraceae bacterium]|nr:TonB-dependent receptor [Leptospiraceae bacterium]
MINRYFAFLLILCCTFNGLLYSQNKKTETKEKSKPSKTSTPKKKDPLADEWEKYSQKTQINVIGAKKENLNQIPGSATIIKKQYLEQTTPVDAMEVLRRVPGATLRFQDAAGLTPNISFRGVSNEESRKTLILEDGILTSLSPYGQPESYYIPQIDRMERVEVIKGSGSILFGPSTIGGIVNFVTRKPPQKPTLSIKAVGGENGYFSNFTQLGGTFNKTAADVSHLYKKGDGYRDFQSFNVNEAYAKLIHEFNPKHTVSLKVGYHDQKARSTYLGLTQGLYWKNPKINPAEFDRKVVKRTSGVLGYEYTMSDKLKFITRAYGTNAIRNWQREDFSYNSLNSFGVPSSAPSDVYAIYAPSMVINRPGDVIYMKQTTPLRNQSFLTAGIESKIVANFEILGIKNEIDLGARVHGEYIHLNFKQSPMPWYRDGISYNQQNRLARAYATYLQDRISITKRLTFIPGVRYENIAQGVYTTRKLATAKDVKEGRAGAVGDIIFVSQGGETYTKILLPGLGMTFEIKKDFGWFAGVHKGFSPPTYGTAISPSGEDYRLKAETSVNYETGLRGDITHYLFWEIAGYIIYFKDQIINTSEIGGELGTRPVNSGNTIHRGVENTITFDWGKFFNLNMWRIPLDLIYSYTKAKSNNYTLIPYITNADGTTTFVDRPAYVQDEKGAYLSTDTNGNYLPYVPMNTGTIALGINHLSGYYTRIEYQYIDKQYSDLLNTKNESVDGSTGVIPAYGLVNLSLGFKHPIKKWSVFIAGKNIQNRQYISGRLPVGIHPGPFRQINFGLSFEIN